MGSIGPVHLKPPQEALPAYSREISGKTCKVITLRPKTGRLKIAQPEMAHRCGRGEGLGTARAYPVQPKPFEHFACRR